MMPGTRLACGIASLLALVACAKDPRTPVPSQPATAALTREDIAKAPAAATAPVAPVATPPAIPPATIVVAQVGWKLAANGLLERPETTMPAASAIHGMAVFRGRQAQQGQVELQVFDAGDRQVATQKARYTLDGDTPVMLEVKAQGVPWPQGQYRALYVCDGRPCWEIRFALQ